MTAVPEQRVGSFFERLVIPLLTLTYTSWLPLRAVEWGRDQRTIAANGQLLLVSRTTYEEIGGFRAVRQEVVDDVAFCRNAKKKGHKVVFSDGLHMASCRMYEGAQETIDGFSKNMLEGVGGKPQLLAACALYFSAFILPYVGLVAAFAPSLRQTLLLPAASGVLCNLAIRTVLAIRQRQPAEGILLHPISVFAFFYIARNSWLWHNRGAIAWAGRKYLPRAERGQSARYASGHQLQGEMP